MTLRMLWDSRRRPYQESQQRPLHCNAQQAVLIGYHVLCTPPSTTPRRQRRKGTRNGPS
ncbi:hypothetical protein BRADI_1g50275v3 [Brachypodium distachyon]|uniref:Uncharacterized protein n=1 Tax=Brachypodium distachyon TaxID=15368 RepID=A0A2K2DQP7_BRADI|nr:hypothetical protein BRADI_1g50275v3 [Brachypodium distachyon]